MSTSGGIFYHLRAYRFRRTLWHSHLQGVSKFLQAWNPCESKLLIVGPSGGYSLPTDFLARFDQVIAVEPDFLGRIIFEKQLSIRPKWIKKAIAFENLKSLEPLLDGDTAVLFSNLLGQVPLPKGSEFKIEFARILQNHSWASYHDAMSGEQIQFDTEFATPFEKANFAEMKRWIYPMAKPGSVLTVNAHEAPDLFPNSEKLHFHYWQWLFTRKRTHLIEGVYHNASLLT